MTKACGVYKIKIGERNFYYGSSVNLVARRQAHLSDLKAGRHHNRWMQRAWDKHQDFSFEIIEECNPKIVIQVEQKYLDEWHGMEGNMNMSNTAQGGCGRLTEEHRIKLSEALSGRTLSDEHKANLRKPKSAETRKKMSEFARNNRKPDWKLQLSESIKGHVVKQETRQKISKTLTGRRLTDEQKLARKQKFDEKVANGWVNPGIGKTISEEQKSKFRATMQAKIDAGWVSPKKGIPMSDEQKKKSSIAHTGKKLSAEHKAKISAALIGVPKRRKSVNP